MPFQQIEELESRELVPGFRGRMIHTEQFTYSFWEIEEGAVLPEHAHPHEQITTVLEGCLEMTVGGETRVVEPGLVAVIPGDVAHSGRALTACRVVDVFCPVREDYKW